MATRRKARGPFVWFRRFLLLLGIFCIVGLIVLLGAYRFGSVGQPDTSSSEGAPGTIDTNLVRTGQGFDNTQTQDGRPIFRIRAERSRQDRDSTAFLEGVLLDIFREEGQTYHIRSDRAVFNEDSDWAELEGDVVLSGWEDLELHTRALEVRQKGQILTSDGEVEFFYPPNLSGRASRMRVDRRTEFIIFSGGVHLQSAPEAEVELRLECERLAYRQDEGVLRALDDVRLNYGPHEIRTRALTLLLADDGKTLKSLRARWDVEGTLRTEADFGSETTVTYRGDFLEMLPDTDTDTDTENADSGLRLVKLESSDGSPVEMLASDPTGLVRRLRGESLVGHLHQGQLVLVEGVGKPMVITEELEFDPPYLLQRACAQRGVARFLENGDLARLDLNGQVDLSTSDLQISGGQTAVMDLVEERLEVEGQAVELYTDRAEVVAPRFSHSMESGLIRAEGGVQATLAESAVGALKETPLGQGEGPIRVDSTSATWTIDPATFAFVGEVRAWRGQNLLLADQLRGEQEVQRLAASGSVKTVWISDRLTEAGDPVLPIEVTAETLTYDRDQDLLIYDSKVMVKQGQRTLACKTLDVSLGASSGTAERMTCREDVRLLDPQAGRRITGDRAVYTLAIDLVEVFGQPVRLHDADNNKLEGRYLLYDIAAGSVQLRSQEPAAPLSSP